MANGKLARSEKRKDRADNHARGLTDAVRALTKLFHEDLKGCCDRRKEPASDAMKHAPAAKRVFLLEEHFLNFSKAMSDITRRYYTEYLALPRTQPNSKPAKMWTVSFIKNKLLPPYSDDFVRSACHGPGYELGLIIDKNLKVTGFDESWKRLPRWIDPSWARRKVLRGFRLLPESLDNDSVVDGNNDGNHLLTLKASKKLLRRYRWLLWNKVKDSLRRAKMQAAVATGIAEGSVLPEAELTKGRQNGPRRRYNKKAKRCAQDVAAIEDELYRLRASIEVGEEDYETFRAANPNYLIFKAAAGSDQLREKLIALPERSGRLRGLAQEFAGVLHKRKLSTVRQDWKHWKPASYRQSK